MSGEMLRNTMQWDKETLLNNLHWLKQILAVIVGVAYGALALEGLVYIFTFIVIVLLVTLMAVRKYLKIEDEDSNDFNSLMGEGIMPSLSLFLLTWLTSYNVFHSGAVATA